VRINYVLDIFTAKGGMWYKIKQGEVMDVKGTII
jgi:hypothetical protein